MLDGFEGKPTPTEWAKLAKRSQDTAGRDIDDLVRRGILERSAGRRRQIQAMPETDNRSDDGRFGDFGFSASSPQKVLSEFQTPDRIGLPEINAWSQPIVCILTRLELLPRDHFGRDTRIAAVAAKNK
ncbi:MAG: hypothetical protein IT566_18175 [Rhodospirillaceae bacterium]|nr:hypothetical protein [Rhodospirillaceae bacterium]